MILIRDGLPLNLEQTVIAEERMHDFQHDYPVDDAWTKVNPQAYEKAAQLLRPAYDEAHIATEISAKLMAGDRIRLTVDQAELRDVNDMDVALPPC